MCAKVPPSVGVIHCLVSPPHLLGPGEDQGRTKAREESGENASKEEHRTGAATEMSKRRGERGGALSSSSAAAAALHLSFPFSVFSLAGAPKEEGAGK